MSLGDDSTGFQLSDLDFFLLLQLISIPMDFFPSISQVEPISPFATQEELKEWNKRENHRMRRQHQHQ